MAAFPQRDLGFTGGHKETFLRRSAARADSVCGDVFFGLDLGPNRSNAIWHAVQSVLAHLLDRAHHRMSVGGIQVGNRARQTRCRAQ